MFQMFIIFQEAGFVRLYFKDMESSIKLTFDHFFKDEAEQLYVQCGRYDLLNKLLRSRNKMDAAHAIAESQDRIHLKNTEHAWAKSLEQSGDLKEAAIRYERANTHKFDIPRMLLDQPQQLESFMAKTKDP